MLHEIFLSLSGHPSPLWDQVKEGPETSHDGTLAQHISPPERAMLASLEHISCLHIELKDHIKQIVSSQQSTICRAVASSIAEEHLARFRKQVLEVESSILSKDAGYVGGYDIVPLSTIVGDFAPWTRRLEWLSELTEVMLPHKKASSRRAKCTGAVIVDFLEKETYTGYSDLEGMAVSLLRTAHGAWMRQVSAWVLYGNLPAYGAEDFFIQLESNQVQTSDVLHKTGILSRELLPRFLDDTTAESILAIGNSLNHIRSHSKHSTKSSISDPALELLPQHLEYLKSLSYPLSGISLANCISEIRLSISQNVLSNLLPLHEIREILDVLHDYLLLSRGEFAISLIAQADRRILSRNDTKESTHPVRKVGRLDGISMKDAELAAVLQQTWSELANLQKDDDLQDEIFEQANSLLRLTTITSGNLTRTISTLLPTPSILTVFISSKSPLTLFLSSADVQGYSHINSYLLSIRRAQIHLSALWKLTPLRRCHPTPLGPPLSSTRAGKARLAVHRARDDARTKQIRKHWAITGKVLFVLNELGAYFQGEVINRRWIEFRKRIDGVSGTTSGSRPGSAKSSGLKASQTTQRSSGFKEAAIEGQGTQRSSDPATLAEAHRGFLKAIHTGLFLDDESFVDALRELLTIVDHFIALFPRLQSVWQGLDLQEDEGVVDALTNYKKDEGEVWWEMDRSRKVIEERIRLIIDNIRNKDKPGKGMEEEMVSDLDAMSVDDSGSTGRLLLRRGRTIEQLVMKLDFLAGGKINGDERGIMMRYEDDE